MATWKLVCMGLAAVVALFAIWNWICLRKKRQEEEKERRRAELIKQADDAGRKTNDHRMNVSNRIFNALTDAAMLNSHCRIAVKRWDDDNPYCVRVGIYEPARGAEYAHFPGLQILEVRVGVCLPLGEYKGSSIKPLTIFFGPAKLQMFNNGKEEELTSLLFFLARYVSDYGVREEATIS